jgi:Protein of unknown function (DUF3828)
MASRTVIGSLLGSLCVLLGACTADPDERLSSPEGTVGEFYAWRVRQPAMTMPSKQQMSELRPYVSDELYALLTQASEEARQSSKPGRRRSFIDGDLFSSLSDGPTSFVQGEMEGTPTGDVEIPVRLTSAQQLPAVYWVDRVRVVRQDDRYVIADIYYANHWRVGNKQTLVAALRKQNKRKRA